MGFSIDFPRLSIRKVTPAILMAPTVLAYDLYVLLVRRFRRNSPSDEKKTAILMAPTVLAYDLYVLLVRRFRQKSPSDEKKTVEVGSLRSYAIEALDRMGSNDLRLPRGSACARISSLTIGKYREAFLKQSKANRCQVKTNFGIIEGKRYVTRNGFKTDYFLGVPYAKPPLGDLRFERPQSLESWEGVRKCKRFGNRSIQDDQFWDKFVTTTPQSEDCLYLNIFAPAIDQSKKYPVMFYIHGGGFMMDSTVRYKPDTVHRYLIEFFTLISERNKTVIIPFRLLVCHGVVVVTIQYRLGFLGFLCTGDSVARGNYGLWDQIEALKWTKENIHHFGGDPNRITVAGQSAGAVSADLLSLSPLSRDMFRQKILMAGNTFCYWSTNSKEKVAEYCRQKALKLGWKPKSSYQSREDESRDMLEFMRRVPASKLRTHMVGNRVFFDEFRLPLTPVVDGEVLPKSISQLRAEAPPMASITGVGQEESLLFLALRGIRGTQKDMEKVVQELSNRTSLNVIEVKDIMRRLYGDISELQNDKKAMQKIYATCISDIFSNYGCFRYLVHSQRHDRPTFGYYFAHTSRNMWGWLAARIPFLAATHGSEIIYLFDCNYFASPLPMTKKDRMISKMISSSFMEFVKTTNPNSPHLPSKWEAISKNDEIRLLKFCEKPCMINRVFNNRMETLETHLKKLLPRKNQQHMLVTSAQSH
ncbi:Carboxylesterase [Dictyocaulus viviparus]|uniref:Carboxylic ester hydrolase n=1 Tax=Dictyocaulus viviparus TaxID=29172 RepID=A0A0D8Y631_DICVI|nr:Carboxylesterase [Dictyocaulus viviparus]